MGGGDQFGRWRVGVRAKTNAGMGPLSTLTPIILDELPPGVFTLRIGRK